MNRKRKKTASDGTSRMEKAFNKIVPELKSTMPLDVYCRKSPYTLTSEFVARAKILIKCYFKSQNVLFVFIVGYFVRMNVRFVQYFALMKQRKKAC